MQAWSDGDAAAFASLFRPDADFVAFSGVHLAGHSRGSTSRGGHEI
ncbi:MAG: SgcJ/EcaC family oxidoreductase [Chloroflexi bacterium]|nr:SgcJ/EcaC family oxidoreductase [Chloroflexota bacterium]MBV9595926.1 SgcJ/EcaC family oxidoreductase [Chloroflexota bacterium]